MNARCTQAQETVSAAYDGHEADALAVESARAHCAMCSECERFLQLLERTRDLAPPRAPESLISAILAQARSAPHATTSAPDIQGRAAGTDHAARPHSPLTHLRTWKQPVPWVAIAAFVAVGALVAMEGVRYILEEPTLPLVVESTGPHADPSHTPEAPVEVAPVPQDYAAQQPQASIAATEAYAEDAEFVAFEGFAYRRAQSTARPIGAPDGTTLSALDAGGPPAPRNVWRTAPREITLDLGGGDYALFERVERAFRGRTYGLVAERVDSFGESVALPPGMPRPATADGSPAFTPAGVDDLGVEVFVRPGENPADGFALAPGPYTPEWTWWAPIE